MLASYAVIVGVVCMSFVYEVVLDELYVGSGGGSGDRAVELLVIWGYCGGGISKWMVCA